MENIINLRHIRELRDIPVSEMTDEEIVKAAMDRLKTKSVMLVYDNDGQYTFLGR